MHVNQLRDLIKLHMGIRDDEDTFPFKPKYREVLGENQGRNKAVVHELALCPGSCLMTHIPFTNTFNESISGIDTSFIILTTKLRGDFKNSKGVERKNQTYFADFKLFFFQCEKERIKKLMMAISTEGVSLIYIEHFLHLCPQGRSTHTSSNFEYVGRYCDRDTKDNRRNKKAPKQARKSTKRGAKPRKSTSGPVTEW